MNATAELAASRQQSLLTLDDSSNSNTFYGGQHLGLNLFDDTLGLPGTAGANPGHSHLINFSVSLQGRDLCWGRLS